MQCPPMLLRLVFVMAPFAAFGRGCWHCETGIPVEEVRAAAGIIVLCLECVMLWFPGRRVDWWEQRHARLADHEGDAIRAAVAKQILEAPNV